MRAGTHRAGDLGVGSLVVVVLGVGARRGFRWVRPAIAGVDVGGLLLLVGMWARDSLDDAGWNLTPEEVQLAAINAWLHERDFAQAEYIDATVHHGGGNCGGVVELRTTAEERIFVVGHDSGAAMGERFDGTLSEAMEALHDRGYDCPEL